MPLPPAGNPIGLPFIELQSVDSTNKYAMNLIQQTYLSDGQDSVQHGMAIFAHEQTDGKGQRAKKWSSKKGENIILSIILNPYPLKVSEIFLLSTCMALSVFEFFEKYAGNEGKIKWPNDIYWRDRKAGGILIENIIGEQKSESGGTQRTKWKWAVAGIGININQTVFPSFLPNPVSLKQITGKHFEPVALAKELCLFIDKNFRILSTGNLKSCFDGYLAALYKKNEKVKLKKGNRVFEAVIKGVAENGQLIIQHSIEERIDFGEAEWVIN